MLLVAADRSDPDHTGCRELLEMHPGPLVTTELVIAESGWLLALGGVDSSIVAAAERLRVTTIATLDRRHFGLIRPDHVQAFELLL